MVTFSKITGLRCWLRCYVSQRQNWPRSWRADTGASTGNNIKSWLDTDSYRLYYRRDRVVPRLAVPSYFRWFYVPSRNRNGWHWLRIISGIPDWYRQLINGEYIPH